MLKRMKGRDKALAAMVIFLALLPGGRAVLQKSYQLTYRFAPGDRFQYSMYIVGQMTTGESSVQQIKLQYSDLWEVVEEDKIHGLFKVVESSAEFSGTEFDLRSFGVPAKSERIERMIDPSGQVAKVVHYTEGTRYYLLPLVLSPNPVAEGTRWKLAQPLKMPLLDSEAVTSLVVVYTVEDINSNYKGRGHAYARVRVDGNYNYDSDDKSSGILGAFQGKIIFDLVDSRIMDYQITENRKEWSKPANRGRTTNLQITCIEHM
ncbi:MAG TPA: hypothetical protein VM658_21475 [bacterium]|nr:hypothetical protein [bacterium]